MEPETRKHSSDLFYYLQLVVDMAVVFWTYWVGYYIQRVEFFENGTEPIVWKMLIVISIAAFFVFLFFKTFYCGKEPLSSTIINVIISIVLIAVISIFIDYLIKGSGIFRLTAFIAVMLQAVVLVTLKILAMAIYRKLFRTKDACVIGATMHEAAHIAIKHLKLNYGEDFFKYVVQQDSPEILAVMQRADTVYISLNCDKEKTQQWILFCLEHHIHFAVFPNLSEIAINAGTLGNLDDMLYFDIVDQYNPGVRVIKRIIDIVVSLILLILFLPIMLVFALLIGLKNDGPVLYKQNRLTTRNKVFKIYKFRTMVQDAEKQTGAVLSTRDDDRITRLGKLMRATRIDEMPQLFNVLIGDMSLVGPRPERPEIADEIIKDLPEFSLRTRIKPGLTGLAQTKGKYETEFKQKLFFDIYYIQNLSIRLDLQILIDTLRVVMKPSAAQGVAYDIKANTVEDMLVDMGIRFTKNEGYLDIDRPAK